MLPLRVNIVQFFPEVGKVLFGQDGIDLYRTECGVRQRQRGDHKVTFRGPPEIAVHVQHLRHQNPVGEGGAEFVHKPLGNRVVRLHDHRTGDIALILLVALQKRTKVKRNKRDFVFVKFYMEPLGEQMGKEYRHVVNRRVISFELCTNGIGVADAEGAPSLSVIHMEGKLLDKFIVEFRCAIAKGYPVQQFNDIINKILTDKRLNICQIVLCGQGNQGQNLLVVPLRNADAIIPGKCFRDPVCKIDNLIPVLEIRQQLQGRCRLLLQIVLGAQPDEDDQQMNQQIVHGEIV